MLNAASFFFVVVVDDDDEQMPRKNDKLYMCKVDAGIGLIFKGAKRFITESFKALDFDFCGKLFCCIKSN